MTSDQNLTPSRTNSRRCLAFHSLALITVLSIALWLADVKTEGAEVSFAWAPSPDDHSTNGLTYNLYAHTNRLSDANLAQALVSTNVGTNLTTTLSLPAAPIWYVAATASDAAGVQSRTSNQPILKVRDTDEVVVIAARGSWQRVNTVRVQGKLILRPSDP